MYIDEGSVINCCSFAFAKLAKLPIDPVLYSGVGANKSHMKIAGITRHDIKASVIGVRDPCKINIAQMIVIYVLGTDILFGQPAKVDNCIITVLHLSQILFKFIAGKQCGY